MANPTRITMLLSASAGSSFTTFIPVLNYQLGSVHVVYTGLDTASGGVNVRGSNDPNHASTSWSQLNSATVSLLSSPKAELFAIRDIGYHDLQVEYLANSNTTGQISIYAVMKSYG